MAVVPVFAAWPQPPDFSSSQAQFPGQGHGNWKMTVTFTGTSSTPTTSDPGATISPVQVYYTSQATTTSTGLNSTVNLSTLNNNASTGQPTTTTTGGITGSFLGGFQLGTLAKSASGTMSQSSAQMVITLTWQTTNNDLVANPVPPNVPVRYRRQCIANANATASVAGQSATSDVVVSCDGAVMAQNHASATGPGSQNQPANVNTDTDFVAETLHPAPGSTTVTKTFSLVVNISNQADAGSAGGNGATGTANGKIIVDFCLEGFDLARFGPSLHKYSGNNWRPTHDPTFTRWLPLSFAPLITSQPFRTQSGALPAPWGNANCYYSLTLRQEPSNPNLDLEGYGVSYLPSAGADGTYNSPGAPYRVLAGPMVPAYAITDAGGERLVFDSNMAGFDDVHSTLSAQQGGLYVLSNAGPPGALKQKGYFTYTFQQVSTNPLVARLIAIQDELGNQQTLTWGSAVPFLTVTDSSSGRRLVFHADASGYVSSVDAPALSGSTPNTHTVTTFDTTGHMTGLKVYTGDGLTLLATDTFTYGGANGDAIASASQGLSTASFSYISDSFAADPFGLAIPRLSSATYGSSTDTSSSDDGLSIQGTYSYTWAPFQKGYDNWGNDARTNTVTDPKGNKTSILLQLTNSVTGAINGELITGPSYTGAAAGLTTLPWQLSLDANQNLTALTDPLNHTWQWSYSTDGKLLLSATDPTGLIWTFRYGENLNPASRLTSLLDPGGAARVQLAYNSFGQPISSTVPAGVSASGTNEVTQFSYDVTTGDLTRLTNPLGDALGLTSYDALGDPLTVALYPDTGNPATSTTPLVTSIQYNAAQLPTQITDPSGVSLVTTFNNGVPTLYKLVNQGVTQAQMSLSYDSRGRVYSTSDLVGTLAQFKYDKNSNVTKVLDGKGNATRLNYGPNNEPTGVVWPSNNSASRRYDAGGRVTSTTDERGVVTNFLYYADNRLSDLQFPATPAQNVHYTYDNAGRLLSVSDATGTRQYTYDPTLKRLQSVTTTLSALPAGHNSFAVAYSYYADGKLASMSSPAGTTSYTYDGAGHLIGLHDPFGNTTTWTYDHAGRVTSESTQTASSGLLTTTYSWGVSGLAGDPSLAPVYLRNIYQYLNGSLFWNYSLQHSYLGQVLLQSGQGPQAWQSGSESYSYDGRGRLASDADSYKLDSQTTLSDGGTFSYDLANNLQGGVNGWVYNANNQLTSAPALGGMPGGTGLAYDASGHLTSLSGATLGYDCWGRLVSISSTPFGAVSFTYDAAGRRVSKTVGSATTYYLYSGDALLAEIDSNGTLVKSYCWGRLGLLSDRVGGQSRFYLYDGLNNTRNLVSATGAVLSSGAYTAWGRRFAVSVDSPLGWKGRFGAYLDNETGLLLLGARYYAPALGRFLSRDPSGFVNGANLYAYCMDDPVNFHDPTGELSVGDVGGWIDEHMMGGATQHFGEVAGRYDAGKASPWEVAGAAANWGLELANTAFLAKDIGQLGLNAARNGLSRLPFRSSLGGGGPLEGGGGLVHLHRRYCEKEFGSGKMRA